MNASGGADGGVASYAAAASSLASRKRPDSASAYMRVIMCTSGLASAISSGI